MAQQTRKDPRAKVLSMTVRYKSATLDEFIEHHSHDVSRGGMFIKTPQPFPPGTLLKFEVRIAEDLKVMQGVGRVVWKRDASAGDIERPAGMGVKFIKLDDESRRLIDQLLSSRKDEVSTFDAERPQTGVDTEPPVGLSSESLSSLSVASAIPSNSTPAPAGDEPTFFPKTEHVPLPPPEDRTVMKQASELLEEALREVGSATTSATEGPSLPPRFDEKEDTKPNRPSTKPSDSASRLPPSRIPPTSKESSASLKLAATDRAKIGGSGAVSLPTGTPSERAQAAPTLAAKVSAEEITDMARGLSALKPTAAVPGVQSGKTKPTSHTTASTTSSVASSAGASTTSGSIATKAVTVAKESGSGARVPANAAEPVSGSARGLFWFVAVAACAAATWWLWRPRPAEPPPSEPPAAVNEAPKPVPNAVDNAATAALPADQTTVAVEASAVPSVAAGVQSAAPSAVQATAAPPVESAAPAAAVAVQPTTKGAAARTTGKTKRSAAATEGEESPAPAPEATAPSPVPGEAPAEAATQPGQPIRPVQPAEPVQPAQPAPEPKPAASPEQPASPPPAAAVPAPPAAAAAAKPRKGATADSDNPY
jgi:uncharacterized protein (TIGR02266 family)